MVDDNSENLQLASEMLVMAGYDVRTARDGPAAIERAARIQPDLIVLDAVMPVVDGFETCRRLKGDAVLGKIPVIFMTVLNAPGDLRKAFEFGAADYLIKPIEETELLARVQTQLTVYRFQQSLERQVRQKTEDLSAANEQLRAELDWRAKTEEQLRYIQSMESLGLLTGRVAHDFNNILSIIACANDIVVERLRRGGTHFEETDAICDAVDCATRLIGKLRAFGRDADIHPEILDLNEVIVGAEPMLSLAIGTDVAMTTSLDPRLRATRADKSSIEQIIMNLVINAVHAMPKGGTLSLITQNVFLGDDAATHHEITPGHFVELKVTDTGIGMDEATRKRIFEPYFTTKDPELGSGLGLSTVYGIVRQSGGYICVGSDPDAGATFTIGLPAVRDAGIEIVGDGDLPKTLMM